MSAETVIDSFFTAFAAGDVGTLTGLFADEIDFRVHGSELAPWTGERSRRDQLPEFFAAFAVLGPAQEYRVVHRILTAEEGVVFGRAVFPVTATGKTFRNDFALHIQVRDDTITSYHMYEDSLAIHEAFTAGR